MNRKTKAVVGGVGIVVLLAILASTTMGATAEFVSPTDLEETDAYDGDLVKLEGRVVNLQDGDRITFDVADANHTKAVVYEGEMPETMSKGRLVVAEGQFDGETVHAESLTVRAHEGEGGAPEGHNKSYNGTKDGYNGTDVPSAPS